MRFGTRVQYDSVLDIPEGVSGDFAIKHEVNPAGKVLRLSTFRTAMNGQKVRRGVRYPVDTKWHYLTENGGVWMSDLPIEQVQHDEELKGMDHTVLVGGLGIGYAVTALAVKRSVKRIVVVEKEQDVINLVWPHTQHHHKAELVHGDLFDYLKRTTEKFRWGFYDIWQSDGEATFHLTVVPLRKLSAGKVHRVRCWNEDVMRGQLYHSLLSRLLMIKNPEMIPSVGNQPKDRDGFLHMLTHPDREDNPWITWSAPFFEKVKSNPEADWTEEASVYAATYGLL